MRLQIIFKKFFPLLITVVVASCVPKPGDETDSGKVSSGGTVTSIPNNTPFLSGVPTVVAYQDRVYSWTPTANDTGLTFSATGMPSWMSINTSTGELSGVPRDDEDINNLRIRAGKSNRYTEIGPFSLQVYGDPLKTYQWHLRNYGQTNFATNGGTSGEDLSADQVFQDSNLGEDIEVVISDSGLDIDHPDLFVNVLSPLCKDYTTTSPYYGDPGVDSTGDHGTSVAGIIGAAGWNGIGVRGIASEAKLIGYNYLGSGVSQTTAIQLDQASGDHDVYNYSYGSTFYPAISNANSSYDDQLEYGVSTQRGGKGSVYVKSAGNSFQECDFQYSGLYLDLLCFSHNSVAGAEDELPWNIIVGATNALGVKASYSSHGANLWVAAPGGEYGTTNPAIMTTDVAGCSQGYSRFGVAGIGFKNGSSSENSSCDYTHDFNGTSSAAPMVSGVVALMMEVNTSLTWRDIKHILAVTAQKVDSSSTDTVVDSSTDFDNGPFSIVDNDDMIGHVYSQGWVTNGAGYSFHNYYGFGQVDADAAVAMAKTYSAGTWSALDETDPSFVSSSSTVNLAIPDSNITGLSDTITVAHGTNLTIEAVQIKLNITHKRPGDIGIELTSPAGTKSILMNVNNSLLLALDSSGSPDWVDDHSDSIFLTNAFYGESSNGTWTLRVIDGLGTDTGSNGLDLAADADQKGNLVNWSINVLGR